MTEENDKRRKLALVGVDAQGLRSFRDALRGRAEVVANVGGDQLCALGDAARGPRPAHYNWLKVMLREQQQQLDGIVLATDGIGREIELGLTKPAGLLEQALLAGVHVLLEWPLLVPYADAVSDVDLAGKCGLVLSVVSDHVLRLESVRQLIAERVGQITRARVSWRRPRRRMRSTAGRFRHDLEVLLTVAQQLLPIGDVSDIEAFAKEHELSARIRFAGDVALVVDVRQCPAEDELLELDLVGASGGINVPLYRSPYAAVSGSSLDDPLGLPIDASLLEQRRVSAIAAWLRAMDEPTAEPSPLAAILPVLRLAELVAARAQLSW